MKFDFLKAGKTALDYFNDRSKGYVARKNARFEADQYRWNAKRARLKGERESAQIRDKGLQVAGAAKVAMAAQGGTVDSEMLSEIKQDSELDAISAMWDAKADALQYELVARSREIEGDREYRNRVLRATTNVLSKANTFRWGGQQGDYSRWSAAQRRAGQKMGRGR